MSNAREILSHFDEDGRFYEGPGALEVVFFKKDKEGENRDYPGKLIFNEQGLCVAATIDDGVEVRMPGGAPLTGYNFMLHFKGEDDALVLSIEDGIVSQYAYKEESPLPASGTFRGEPLQRQMPVEGYRMRIDHLRQIVANIDADSSEAAQILCDYLAANGIRCHVDESTVEIDDMSPYVEVQPLFRKFMEMRMNQ